MARRGRKTSTSRIRTWFTTKSWLGSSPEELLVTILRRRAQWFTAEEYGFKGITEDAAKIVRAGGRVCLGSHGQMQGIGCH